jgi:hypothetical protein
MTAHDLTMTVECRTCPVRELHCGECMVPVLLDLAAPSLRVDLALDPQERAAVTRLVSAGLVDADTAARARAQLTAATGHAGANTRGGRAVG